MRKKVLVVDLDNTLWEGVLGDEGAMVTKPYWDFQEALVDLKDSGILLAIISKNDELTAIAALESMDMPLDISDFVTYRISWDPKPRQLESIAEELNLSTDSFVFFDDSRFERELMLKLQPDVTVLEVPTDPAEYVSTLHSYKGFNATSLTSEDLIRTEMYKENSIRKAAHKNSTDLASFLSSLNMQAKVFKPEEQHMNRVLQLLNKTNQFTTTGERYTRADLDYINLQSHWDIYAVSLSDCWGDSGIVAVLISQQLPDNSSILIDTFAMSCRVFSRTLEYAILKWLRTKANVVLFESVPTSRNSPALEFIANSTKEHKVYVNLTEVCA